MAHLKHANIVQVYDVGCEGKWHYIIMELVRGVNLRTLAAQRGPFSLNDTIDIITQTTRGLAHAHAHGVVHRDIKPTNIVLEDQTIKILDLGLAKRRNR